MNDAVIHEEAFNMLCGKLLGEGVHRKVFACRIRPDLVVKVEEDPHRYFANVHEDKFWSNWNFIPAVAKWLAPIEFMSPDGRILLQKRADPLGENEVMPEQVPWFMRDLKRENFGRIDGVIVCVDYAMVHMKPSTRMKKAQW